MLVEKRRQKLTDEYKLDYIKAFGTPPGPNAIREIAEHMNSLLSGSKYKWIERGKYFKVRLLVKDK
jgi:hypothetical protein